MLIDFIEVKPKRKKFKIFLTFLSLIIIISVVTIFSMNYIKKNKLKFFINENKIKIVVENNTENYINNTETVKTKNNFSEKIKNIYSRETKVVYLTFDDGPSQAVTPLILDVLKEEGIKATFFVLGSNVDNNPDIVKRAYNEGHYIANHGYTHSYSKIYKSKESVLEEFNKTEDSIKNAVNNREYSSQLFRFPGGYSGGKYFEIKKEAAVLLEENNISYIDWNCLTGDAEGANTRDKILNNVEKYSNGKGNIVLLMHDAATKILTYETLKDVIYFYREKGYIFENFYNLCDI